MAASKTETTYTKSPRKYSAMCVGDSLTLHYGILSHDQFYPYFVQGDMQAVGCPIQFRNAGISGDTTSQMVARMASLLRYGTPDMAVIYGGYNDSGNASSVSGSGATTTSIPVQTGHGVRFAVGSYVRISSQSVRVTAVATDTLTVSPALSGAPANTTAVAIDTQVNLQVIAQYLQAAGCTRIMIVGLHYANYSSGGDTTSAQSATFQTLRGLQSAAATAVGATYVDAYAWMRLLILNGTTVRGVVYVQGDHVWHLADSNIHLTGPGENILADAINAAIPAAWITALQ